MLFALVVLASARGGFAGASPYRTAESVAGGPSRPQLVIQPENGDAVQSVAFSPDGRMLASGGYDETARFWDMQTGQLLRTLVETYPVFSIAFSPDGRTLAIASDDDRELAKLRLWDVRTGKLLQTLRERHDGFITSVAFSPDGRTLATANASAMGNENETAELWDMQTGKVVRTLQIVSPHGYTSSVYAVAFSPDGKILASGRLVFGMIDYGEVNLWSVQTGDLVGTLTGDAGVTSAAFSPDGRKVTSGGFDKTVRLWDVRTRRLLRTLRGHTDEVVTVAFSPDGKMLASGARDNTVRLWDAVTGRLRQILRGHPGWVTEVAFSPDGRKLVSGSKSGRVQLWNARTGRLLVTLLILPPGAGEDRSSNWIAFTPEGYYDASAGARRFIRWRVGGKLLPVDAYERIFHRPQRVRKALEAQP